MSMKLNIILSPVSSNILKLISYYFYRQLDFNNISSITKGWLYGLSSLHHLTVSSNIISSIEEDGWEFCQQLMEL